MKKVISLLAILCLASCTLEERPRELTSGTIILEAKEFSYKGHDYIWFNYNGYRSGVSHNPECKKCFEQFD